MQTKQPRQDGRDKQQSVTDIETIGFPTECGFADEPVGHDHGDHTGERAYVGKEIFE